jgi:L-seryl-tRNA(Ser) seleniumtransferase
MTSFSSRSPRGASVELALRALPRTDRVLDHQELASLRTRFGRKLVREWARRALDDARARVRSGEPAPSEEDLVRAVRERARTWTAARTRRVVNATGIVLHTNLGRAPLSSAALAALAREGAGYVNLEIDLETGGRGKRAGFVESAIASIAGAEDALVVNNNAAAVLLALDALAGRRAVLVSRGELVEIGGGFRVPEVVACSGARLVEVGTTNRTRVDDYANALAAAGAEVAAILRVHPGNFRQEGFVERPLLAALVALARKHDVAIIEDLGGGALVDLTAHGLEGDPLVSASVAAGIDVVSFSTDKILGGPQGGVLVGRAAAIDRARRAPLARALRMGRLPLVALEATIDAYIVGAQHELPVLRMAAATPAELRARAEGLASKLRNAASHLGAPPIVDVIDVSSLTGGGTYPTEEIPSIALRIAGIAGDDAERLASALRIAPDPVLARIEKEAVLCDVRTVLPEEDERLIASLVSALEQ